MSTYTTSLGLEEITPGDQAGLWGNTTNNNLALIDQAIAGVTPVYLDNKSGYTYVLTNYNGAFDESRAAVINVTYSSVQATGANFIEIPSAQKLYVFRNSSGQDITVQTAAAAYTVILKNGEATLVFCDGTNAFPGIATSGVGTLTVPYGGTGVTSFGGSPGFVYTPGGTSALGVVTAVNLASQVTGTLPVGNGGSGQTSFTSGALLVGNGSGSIQTIAPGANTYVLTSNGSSWSAQPAASATYPSAGVAVSTGTAWAASYSSGNPIPVSVGGTGSSTQNFVDLNNNQNISGTKTFTTGAPIKGITDGSSAAAGYIGELIKSTATVSAPNTVATNVTSITLTPGDWDVWGDTNCNNNANIIAYNSSISTTSGVIGPSGGIYINGSTIGPISLPALQTNFNVTVNTTIYLVVYAAYTGTTASVSGAIYARRVR